LYQIKSRDGELTKTVAIVELVVLGVTDPLVVFTLSASWTLEEGDVCR